MKSALFVTSVLFAGMACGQSVGLGGPDGCVSLGGPPGMVNVPKNKACSIPDLPLPDVWINANKLKDSVGVAYTDGQEVVDARGIGLQASVAVGVATEYPIFVEDCDPGVMNTSCLDFDGTNDKLVASTIAGGLAPPYTQVVVYRHDSMVGNQTIMDGAGGATTSNRNWIYRLDSTNTTYSYNETPAFSGGANFQHDTIGEWHVACVTIDPSTSDSIQFDHEVHSGDAGDLPYYGVVLGATEEGGQRFNGRISQAMVWATELVTCSDVMQHLESTQGAFPRVSGDAPSPAYPGACSVCQRPEGSLCPVSGECRIGILGDSISATPTGDTWSDPAFRKIGEACGEFYNTAGSGFQMQIQIEGQWIVNLRPWSPDVVVILGGVNDIIQDASMATAKSKYDGIVDQAITDGVAVVTIAITPWGSDPTYVNQDTIRTNDLNAHYAAKMAAVGGVFVDVGDDLRDPVDLADGGPNPSLAPEYNCDTVDSDGGPNTGDGLHVSDCPAGKKIIRDKIWELLYPGQPVP